MRPTPAEPNADSTATGKNENLDSLKQERDALIQERDGLFDRLARVTAEFQNARRRLEADKDQAVSFANTILIKAMLPIIDNFERALAVDPAATDPASILKGMQIVHDQWMNVLKGQYVEAITPERGAAFDPATMEALIHQADDKLPPNSVTQMLQRGYSLHGRTLRPAQVAVSKPQ
jgi:molecular chaperone GrpE